MTRPVFADGVFEEGVFLGPVVVTTSPHDLLPGNATQLERDLSRSVSYLPRIGSVSRIRSAKYVDIPDDVLPWLVYEYNLGPVSEYIDDLRQVLALGIPWQRIRGTPAAIFEALSWLGYSPFIDEAEEAGTSWWSDYHLGFVESPPSSDLLGIYSLATLSNPARSRTQRIFSIHYDYRRLVYSWPEGWSSGRRWCDHSGIRGLPGMEDTQVSLSLLDTGSVDVSSLISGDGGWGLGGFLEPFIWRWSSTGIWSGRWHDLGPAGDSFIGDDDGVQVYENIGTQWPAIPWPDATWSETTLEKLAGSESFAPP